MSKFGRAEGEAVGEGLPGKSSNDPAIMRVCGRTVIGVGLAVCNNAVFIGGTGDSTNIF